MQVSALGLSKRLDVPLGSNAEADIKGCGGFLADPLQPFPLWSLTASSSTVRQRRNRWRAVAPEDFATPGLDRVRQEVATPGLRIPLEQQYGDLLLASARNVLTAFDIVAPKFLKIEALRAEYQNPLMED